ncbi:disease resistance protein RUN1-like [Cryptomeria japonica]|uniref:disease resistance protein RUN1-like n=1 Tax=Cryptomeria japonica TaxID=3369 RepID=UPI0027DA775A|nr:disease resistance protein RUN1-like [Cryptomeria japonica]
MASTSNTSSLLQRQDFAPSTSTSAGSSAPAFVRYKPPTTKLPFQSDKRYHVFLSFRGEDVRKTLVDHLFQALSAAGLNVFLDSDKLGKGEMIWKNLERAIEGSAIRIPIFSKGYVDSAWCLKEAAAMLNSPALIIPLFYHVEPNRYRGEEIDGWKRALRDICKRSGWSMDITGGFEARLVKMVVNDLIMTLDRVPLEVAKHPVRLDSVKNSLIQKLNLNSMNDVLKIGIWGIGGIGKTTAAKAVYNQVYGDFEAASFVINVRDTAAEAAGPTKLQKKVLKDLSKYDDEVDSVDEGIFLFRERLRRKRVLLILDDVDAVIQLNALVGDWLAPGSRVIITSRDKHILNVAGMSSDCIHEMVGLDINDGLHLFSWNAFLRASPNPDYEDLSKRIVKACKGHPLSLEVIGSFLYDKQDDIGCWTEALHKITLNPDIQERLKISYSALSDEEKEIFVDIACFFIGEQKTCPIVFWKSLYRMVDTALSNLSMKLLIKIDNKGIFEMHDHLRDMGRTIAEKEKEGTRLWEATHLNTKSNVNFSRLRLNEGNPQRLKTLCKLGLRYLHLRNVPIEGMKEHALPVLPPSLIWLRLEHCPIAIGTKGAIKKIFDAVRKPCHSRFVGNHRELKIMQLKDINSLFISSLFSLPNIELLQHLNMEKCKSLENLPDSIGNLSGLVHLNLRGCTRLSNLPNTIGNLSKLQYLNLEWCYRLSNLPDTIGNLSQLQQLDLEGCDKLTNLPDTIGHLSQLQHFNLRGCYRLNNLPNTIGNLSQLQHLDLKWCYTLNNLPNTIGNLSRLLHLDLRGCRSLNNLPDTINNLPQLQYFLC